MLGDRSVNYWVTAIATQASDMGAWLFVGLPAAVFVGGVFQAWIALGLIVGMYLTWVFIAPKLRIATEQHQSLTLPSYFAHRFNDTSGALQLTSSSLSLLFFTFYISASLVGLSLMFEYAFGISPQLGMFLSLATAVLYTLIGGFVAIAWCDLFQGIFLLFMIMLVPIKAFFMLPNGITDIIEAAQKDSKSLSILGSPKEMLSAIILAAGWGLGYFGQPHILMNFMGIDDVKKMVHAKRVGMTWQILVLTAAVSVGIVSIGFFANTPVDKQLVFVVSTMQLFHPFIAGLILCAIIAATLSTADSLILAAGSTIAEDIYKKWWQPNASSHTTLWISRAGSTIISLIALAIAFRNDSSVHNLVNYAWAGLGSSFGPLIITSLYAKNITHTGALCGMIAGGLTSAFWPHTPWFIYLAEPLVPGFFIGLGTIFIISHITTK